MLDLAIPDWRERILTGRPPIPDIPLDEVAAAKAVAIFNALRLPDVIGRPLMADAAGEWYRQIIRCVFGTAPEGDNIPREVREFMIVVPKKNSKSTNGAATMLTALLINRRPRAEFVLIGPTQEVSRISFNQVTGMIEADAEGFLQKRFQVKDHTKEILDRRTRSILKVKSFDSSVVVGSKPCGILLDELHEISSASDASRIIGQLRGGMLANPEAFLIFITTQSDRAPAGIFRDELTKARAIRDGSQVGTMMPCIYEFPEDVAEAARPGETPRWADSSIWWQVNPNAGRSVMIPRLVEEYETARATGVHELARWASQHLNIQIGTSLRTDHWAGAEYWAQRVDTSITFESLLERSEVVVVGIDGGGLDDLFGMVLIGREFGTKRWLVWGHAWCHQGVLDRRKSIASRLTDFEKAGELTIVDDRLDDVSGIVSLIKAVLDRGKLGAVAIDPGGIGEFVDALAEIEVSEENKTLVGVGQGGRLMNAIKTAERRLASGTMIHSGSSAMAWCVGNLKIEALATSIRPTKQNAGDAKIDLAMALFDAADVMSLNPEPATPAYSVYFA